LEEKAYGGHIVTRFKIFAATEFRRINFQVFGTRCTLLLYNKDDLRVANITEQQVVFIECHGWLALFKWKE